MGMGNGAVIVTGASRGIGEAIARELAAAGYSLALVARSGDRLLELAAEIGSGDNVMACPGDISDFDDVQRIVTEVHEKFGGIIGLVNNAGIGSPNVRPENADLAQWRQVQSVNLEGTFLGCKHGIAAMQTGNGGSIINISSIAAFVPTAGDLAYGASKAAVLQLTRSLALHCAQTRSNIRVNSIHPGAIRTSGVEQRRSPETLRQVEGGITMGPMGEPEDIAYAALYLASDESKYVTGHAMIVDGGCVLAPVPPSAPDH